MTTEPYKHSVYQQHYVLSKEYIHVFCTTITRKSDDKPKTALRTGLCNKVTVCFLEVHNDF
jgi:hypothetical protein